MNYVTYEQFGAKADGKTCDGAAMAKAHAYANENGLSVKATEGATYYIGKDSPTIEIRTSTSFVGATVIIDDSEVLDPETYRKYIFSVTPDTAPITTDIPSLTKGQKALDHGYGFPVVIRVYNENVRHYLRRGLNADQGLPATDVLVADADGVLLVGPDWDHPTLTTQYAVKIDDPICIEGGKFITVANRHATEITYYNRGFGVTRSNVTIKNLTHLVEGEGECGAPYSGFISAGGNYRFTLKNCLLTPHKTYITNPDDPTKRIHIGTYDIGLNSTVETSLIGVTQTIDITDRAYWGIMGTNYCKRMLLEDCEISRFDAHKGVSSATVRRCKIGHMGLLLIGFGEFIAEDTCVHGHAFIGLRGDYGSHFDGKVVIRNCTWRPLGKRLEIIAGANDGRHDFGYECRMPHTVEIDGMTVEDGDFEGDSDVFVLPNYDAGYEKGRPYPYRYTKRISAKGVRSASGRNVSLFEIPAQYEGIEIE